jgi:hypothetical protein
MGRGCKRRAGSRERIGRRTPDPGVSRQQAARALWRRRDGIKHFSPDSGEHVRVQAAVRPLVEQAWAPRAKLSPEMYCCSESF